MTFNRQRVIRNPLGRPPSYRPEYAEQLIEYFEAAALDVPREEDDPVRLFPTLSRFATFCGVDQNTLRNWADAKDMDDTPLYPEFFRAYYSVKAYQEAYLIEGFTAGIYQNPGFGALIAKNILAWKDKQDIEQTVTATVDTTVNVTGSLADSLAKIKKKLDNSA